MSNPSLSTVKRLFALSNNKCTFSVCTSKISENADTITGDVCHIKAKNPKGPRYDSQQTEIERNSISNLILLCKRHHKIIDSNVDEYPVSKLVEMKTKHEKNGRRELSPNDNQIAEKILIKYNQVNINHNSGSVIVDSPGAIKADNITIKSPKSKINIHPPEDAISSDINMLGYAKKIIDKFNKFSSKQKRKNSEYNHSIIYTNIQNEFGVYWKYIPKTRFYDLVEYIQKCIDKTMLGRTNTGKGYSSYSEFCKKVEGK